MECYENMPESLQDTERANALYECADTMESISSDLDDVISNLNDVIDTY